MRLFVSVSSWDDPTIKPRIITSTERWVCSYYREKKQQFSQKRSLQFPKSYNRTHDLKRNLFCHNQLVKFDCIISWCLRKFDANYLNCGATARVFRPQQQNHRSPFALLTRFGFFWLLPLPQDEIWVANLTQLKRFSAHCRWFLMRIDLHYKTSRKHYASLRWRLPFLDGFWFL